MFLNNIMTKPILFFLLLSQMLISATTVKAQEPDCNKLGAWVWYVEQTGFTHETLADTLSSLGVKRIYVKVADGIMDTIWWHTIVDEELINTYHAHEMEVYGWSYNYPGSEYGQAQALYKAAQTGYDGYVVDVEHQFDGDSANLHNLFSAFSFYKNLALEHNLADTSFKLGITTWGNPIDHWFRIDVVDPFVDAYFPQTYVEIWGNYYLNNITFWVDSTYNEYRAIGATKPIHQICATERDVITAEQINEFIAASGAKSSLWRVPGGGTPLSIWNTWNEVNWHMNFCDTIVGTHTNEMAYGVARPNPFSNYFQLDVPSGSSHIMILDITGRVICNKRNYGDGDLIDGRSWRPGVYICRWVEENRLVTVKVIKQ
jgi:hypothetical protein